MHDQDFDFYNYFKLIQSLGKPFINDRTLTVGPYAIYRMMLSEHDSMKEKNRLENIKKGLCDCSLQTLMMKGCICGGK